MITDESKLLMAGLSAHGLAENRGRGDTPDWEITAAGSDFIESVLLQDIRDRLTIYALGRQQGLRESRFGR